MTLRETYLLAIKLEIKAKNLYILLTENTENEEVKKVLNMIIPIEQIHEDKLKEIYKEKFNEDLPNLDEYLLPKFTKKNDLDNPIDVIEFALNDEKTSQELYEKLANEADNEDVKNVFLQLAEDEKNHTVLLNDLINSNGADFAWHHSSEFNGLFED